MKFRLTETEKINPDYRCIEEFDTREEAQERMKDLYKNFYENPAIDKAEINENSAIVYVNDGNEIEWDIEDVEDIVANAFEYDEALTEDEMEDRLKEVLGKDYNVKWFDSWIDNGCEEGEEDEYVKGVGFTITDKDGESIDVVIYYGDCTLKIGCVETR